MKKQKKPYTVMSRKQRSLKERLYAGFTKNENGCWVWQKCRDNAGYGQIRVNGRTQRAHRVSWQIHKGEIPKGMHLLHRCDNPSCVRPDHLFIGTNYDNILDCIEKGRNNIGERNARAKLTAEQVTQIRKMYSSGISQQDVGEMFGVTQSCVFRVVTSDTWRHIEVAS